MVERSQPARNFPNEETRVVRTTYIVIHDDSGQSVKAWLPDFPGVTLPGDRLSDTLTVMPMVLQQHVDEMIRRGETLPEPTIPNLWDIHAKHPDALIGFAEVVTGEND
jgi:predicted RNase H-like HicB family nuclease